MCYVGGFCVACCYALWDKPELGDSCVCAFARLLSNLPCEVIPRTCWPRATLVTAIPIAFYARRFLRGWTLERLRVYATCCVACQNLFRRQRAASHQSGGRRSSFGGRFRHHFGETLSLQIWGTAFQFCGAVLVPKKRRRFRPPKRGTQYYLCIGSPFLGYENADAFWEPKQPRKTGTRSPKCGVKVIPNCGDKTAT